MMDSLLLLVKMIAVLIGAGMLGNWFLSELKAARIKGLPWYTPYPSPHGILIVIILFGLPVVAWMIRQ
ncbi:MAG TPA: hypothetical protein VLP30_05255 [Desulfatirhabdiaceae bacterium]|nr:hypothetical protein [Desulfatirhabdiaceae bacterium]